jgi:hypothetical protein
MAEKRKKLNPLKILIFTSNVYISGPLRYGNIINWHTISKMRIEVFNEY